MRADRVGRVSLEFGEPHYRPTAAVVPHAAIRAADHLLIERLRASLDARLATAAERVAIFEADARRRKAAGGEHGRLVQHGLAGGNSATSQEHRDKRLARDEAAATVGLSGRTIADAIAVKKRAPDLYKEAEERERTLASAYREMLAREKTERAPAVDLSTGRANQIANKAYERLANLLGSLEGIVESLRVLKLDHALSVVADSALFLDAR